MPKHLPISREPEEYKHSVLHKAEKPQHNCRLFNTNPWPVQRDHSFRVGPLRGIGGCFHQNGDGQTLQPQGQPAPQRSARPSIVFRTHSLTARTSDCVVTAARPNDPVTATTVTSTTSAPVAPNTLPQLTAAAHHHHNLAVADCSPSTATAIVATAPHTPITTLKATPATAAIT